MADSVQWAWLTTCIYIAVLIVEFPTNWIIQRVPIAKYLGVNIMAWSFTLACHALCWNYPSLVAVRTLLGIFEAVCQPTFLILSTMWYKREEQALIVRKLDPTSMQETKGLIGHMVVLHEWYAANCGRATCVLLQSNSQPTLAPSILAGHLFVLRAVLLFLGSIRYLVASWSVPHPFPSPLLTDFGPDSPMRAKCFSEEDKKLMVERVRSNQTGLQNKKFRAYQMKEAFLDPQSWCYCLIAICTTLPTSGLGSFANIIIKGFHFSVLQTQLLAMVLGVVIIITLFSSTWLVNKTKQNLIVMAIYVIP